jgi:hypothetical protein
MSSSSPQAVSSLQRSNDPVDLPACATMDTKPISFAPLHRTAELENLHDHFPDDDKQIPKSSTTKKVLTKCMTVIGDGSDKQI